MIWVCRFEEYLGNLSSGPLCCSVSDNLSEGFSFSSAEPHREVFYTLFNVTYFFLYLAAIFYPKKDAKKAENLTGFKVSNRSCVAQYFGLCVVCERGTSILFFFFQKNERVHVLTLSNTFNSVN